MTTGTLKLFEATGIEMEYMIVDAGTLEIRPLADEVLREVGGGYEMEVALGSIAWSNELALHVIEFKTNGPVRSLEGVGRHFQEHVNRVNRILERHGARLMPTGMHPWMDPDRDLKLWPHEDNAIYAALDRIFDCRGHGWANLQSTHVNLPFGDDREFGKLHAAIRMVLPILPALAASSPFADARYTGHLDYRMEVYAHNADRIPSVVGHVVPERIFTRSAYEDELLQGIYDDMASQDPEGVLRYEWINARGCIARFDRHAIEIRVIDIQEHPSVDVAVTGAVTAAVRALVEERFGPQASQEAWDEEVLSGIFFQTVEEGDRALITHTPYLRALGLEGKDACTGGELWSHLVRNVAASSPGFGDWGGPLEVILEHGCLARRILAGAGEAPDRERLLSVYRDLCDCLAEGRPYLP